jgi:hypothetical protein
MDVIHLNQIQLSVRWQVAEATLERWRSDRIGPAYLKICSRVMYRLVDIESFEDASMKKVYRPENKD